ncbi:MAG: DEAD/DEAH box helicase [Armatimonadia bacterium]
MNLPRSGSELGQYPDGGGAFEQLHPSVQRWVYSRGWSKLRDIQEQAVVPILAGEDVVIAAPTAAGKTEAAYLPICSSIVGEETTGLNVLHVSPLKALINDQYQRLEDLCADLEVPVHKWHGDVAQSKKQSVVREPAGILLITPESLEAMFVVRGQQLPRLFASLRYVVVDELHVFLDTERGQQLQSLLHRLELLLRRHVPRIGLSATLGDMQLAAKYLRPTGKHAPRLIVGARGGKELRLAIRGYKDTGPAAANKDDSDNHRVPASHAIADCLFEKLRGTNNLIFANSRSNVELYADLLREMCEQRRVPNEFGAHHGNLSKEIREETEERLKRSELPFSAVCTNTLELGIDIGNVESIAQIGSPPSVASIRQRLGRSGRGEGKPAILRLFVTERERNPRTPPQDLIRAHLVQCIAMVNLLLRHWCEPSSDQALHLSTLVQQVLSILAQLSAAHPQPLWEALCRTGPFEHVDQRTFARLLKSMGTNDLISQDASGMLMLGAEGERIVNHYGFYSAFVSAEEYRIVTSGKTLGTLPVDYPVTEGMYIIFAGQRWLVLAVDGHSKVIEVTPAATGNVPLFSGSGGMIHDQVRQEMLAIYQAEDVPAFLDSTARSLLSEGRQSFRQLGLNASPTLQMGNDMLLFCWMGDRVLNTLCLQLANSGFKSARDGVAILVENCTQAALTEHLRVLHAAGLMEGTELAALAKNKDSEKYHWCLDEELLCLDYASTYLDPVGAATTIASLLMRME